METEIKLAVLNPSGTNEQLLAAGFHIHVERLFERNLVLDTGGGELRASNRLLRVRDAGAKITCTYKGPPIPGRHKQREEREFLASSREEILAVLAGLGYSVRFEYQKYRTEYMRPAEAGVVTVDETPIGTYLELEGEGDWIDRVAEGLGFSEADYITDSYGKLYTRWCQAKGIEPSNLVFEAKP